MQTPRFSYINLSTLMVLIASSLQSTSNLLVWTITFLLLILFIPVDIPFGQMSHSQVFVFVWIAFERLRTVRALVQWCIRMRCHVFLEHQWPCKQFVADGALEAQIIDIKDNKRYEICAWFGPYLMLWRHMRLWDVRSQCPFIVFHLITVWTLQRCLDVR